MADRPLPAEQLPIQITGAGVQQLVAGRAEYRLYGLGLAISSDRDVRVTLQDTTGVLFDINLPANGNIVLPESSLGWFRARSGEALNIVNGAPLANIRGVLIYRLFPDHAKL